MGWLCARCSSPLYCTPTSSVVDLACAMNPHEWGSSINRQMEGLDDSTLLLGVFFVEEVGRHIFPNVSTVFEQVQGDRFMGACLPGHVRMGKDEMRPASNRERICWANSIIPPHRLSVKYVNILNW